MADNEETMSNGVINSQTLADAYSFLDRTLDQAGVRATAAFVSAFAAERDAVLACLPQMRALADLVPNWFKWVLPRLESADSLAYDGLEGHQFWKLLAAAGHEIGWHGSTHVPLLDTTPSDAIDIEVALARRLSEPVGSIPTSVIFPRNQVGHLHRLNSAGFTSYRDNRGNGLSHRVMGLARELFVWDQGDASEPVHSDGWWIVPAGHFLNWPAGARRLVPVDCTVRRWVSMLRGAAEHGRYVHMWFHPHNFITAPQMKISFAMIMEEVRALVKSGDIIAMSMSDANLHYYKQ